ncbi:DUF3560 domain-containing protein [Escherichia coli]|nr:DUF3560 domain-containing protein [Escherichia coli]
MAPTTAQIMTENTVSQTYRATYSPDDNKLRLYASLRLDEETYSLINKAGFRWAPKQELFVAPAWTPGREDVLLSLAGDIEDEDSTLFDRQEQRAGRFSDYSDRRAVESEQALAHVDSLASAVPLGQPILVGHHSERRARRHAQKIENGMKRAVMLFERAEYWEQRAQASLRHAKYKERPDVRYRRIKKIEAELRKSQKHIGAGNEVTVVFQDGFQLKTIEELDAEKNGKQQEQNQEQQPQQPQQAGASLNGFSTDQMLKQLGKLDPHQFSPGAMSEGNNNG